MSQSPSQGKGRLSIVGSGPGSREQMTGKAVTAISEAEVIIGNRLYLEHLGGLIEGKQIIWSAMGKEVERAQEAVRLAQGKRVAMISGGDAGIYGMASIVLEVVEHEAPGIEVEVIPGITAASAAASLLGSPLSGDFVIMSLSDLLTPWDEIERRLKLAFAMMVPVAIYNPRSRNRQGNLQRALQLARDSLPARTPIGLVRNAYREEQGVTVTTLGSLLEDDSRVDMHTVLIIGGQSSREWKEGEDVRGIITPRGYHSKYVY